MSLISREELFTYLNENNNHFINSEGIIILWQEEWGLSTHLTLRTHDEGPLEVTISTQEEGPEDFIAGFKIQKLEQMVDLGYNDVWVRYLNGFAEINITPMELEATLTFRIYKTRTLISSLELHFYDEVYGHLSLPEDFERYVSENERRLNIAGRMRYKY